jgi:hypothetical protein
MAACDNNQNTVRLGADSEIVLDCRTSRLSPVVANNLRYRRGQSTEGQAGALKEEPLHIASAKSAAGD